MSAVQSDVFVFVLLKVRGFPMTELKQLPCSDSYLAEDFVTIY